MGFFSYHESTASLGETTNGMGYNFDFGAEYLVTPELGICSNIGYVLGRLPSMDNYLPEGNNKIGGFFRINLTFGIKIHI